MQHSPSTRWKRKVRDFVEDYGQVLYFWFCILLGSLMGITQAIWGDPSVRPDDPADF